MAGNNRNQPQENMYKYYIRAQENSYDEAAYCSRERTLVQPVGYCIRNGIKGLCDASATTFGLLFCCLSSPLLPLSCCLVNLTQEQEIECELVRESE